MRHFLMFFIKLVTEKFSYKHKLSDVLIHRVVFFTIDPYLVM